MTVVPSAIHSKITVQGHLLHPPIHLSPNSRCTSVCDVLIVYVVLYIAYICVVQTPGFCDDIYVNGINYRSRMMKKVSQEYKKYDGILAPVLVVLCCGCVVM